MVKKNPVSSDFVWGYFAVQEGFACVHVFVLLYLGVPPQVPTCTTAAAAHQ